MKPTKRMRVKDISGGCSFWVNNTNKYYKWYKQKPKVFKVLKEEKI